MDLKSQNRQWLFIQRPETNVKVGIEKGTSRDISQAIQGKKSPKYIVKNKNVGIYISIKELINQS